MRIVCMWKLRIKDKKIACYYLSSSFSLPASSLALPGSVFGAGSWMFICNHSHLWQASQGARRTLWVGCRRWARIREWLPYPWPSPALVCLRLALGAQEGKHLGSASCQGTTTFWPLPGENALEGCGSASLTSSKRTHHLWSKDQRRQSRLDFRGRFIIKCQPRGSQHSNTVSYLHRILRHPPVQCALAHPSQPCLAPSPGWM